MRNVNWKEVLIFFVLATCISAPFRLGWLTPQIDNLPGGLHMFFSVLRGIGPLAAYLVMFYVLKSKVSRPNTFYGKEKWSSIVATVVIPVGLLIVGLPNKSGLDTHYYGLMYGLMLSLYALCEEYGWRGYLQQSLDPLPVRLRVLVIAIFWYLWHLNFLVPGIPVKTHVIHFLSLVAGSWGLLKITEVTRSILFAAAVHLSFNLLADVQSDFSGRLYILLACVVVWGALLVRLAKINGLQPSKK